MRAKEIIPASKPRNFVAKNQKTGGAGAHKDKKKAAKQGDVKHKGKVDETALRNLDDLQAKRKALQDLQMDPNSTDPEIKQAIMQRKADLEKEAKAKGLSEYGDTAKGQKMLTKVQKRAVDRMIKADDKRDAKGAKKNQQTANRAWDRMDTSEGTNMDEAGYFGGGGSFGSRRSYQDRLDNWDEGNTEPPNNFAVYINGKKWKVFQGRGQYADDFREKQHYQQLKAWAQQKSAATGKKWEVYITGEAPTA